MKGVRFYAEYENVSKTQPTGNVIAVFVDEDIYWSSGKACHEAIGGIYARPNSPVATTGASLDYLSQKCKRVSEQKAREIHPRLFERLEEVQQWDSEAS